MSLDELTTTEGLNECSRILVVDDIQDNLDLMEDVLEEGPWTVTTAHSAAEALDLVEEQSFDLFLLDVQMPGMDGFELCRRLRRRPETHTVPVVFVTAERTTTANLLEGFDVGGYDYITRPFDRPALVARVRVMLRLRSAEKRLLAIQEMLDEQNRQLTSVNDKLSETCQQMLEQRFELTHKSRQLERTSRIKSEFLASMSHELRTPLNSIIGFTDVLSADQKEPPSPRQMQRLEKIGRNARQLLALINDILDLSKIESERLKLDVAPLDPRAVAADCLELARPLLKDKPVALELNAPERVPTWEGDEVRLRQIIMNLLSNAAKFTDQGRIDLAVRPTDRELVVAVSDTGMGIAPEHLPYLFHPFRQVDQSSTRRAGGTGLGLAICRKLCNALGGSIDVRSELDKGSTFEFALPWRAIPVRSKAFGREEPGEADANASLHKVLLATDDPGTADLTRAHLARSRITVERIADPAALASLPATALGEGMIVDLRGREAFGFVHAAKARAAPVARVWMMAWTEDHQLGRCVQADDVLPAGADGGMLRASGLQQQEPGRRAVVLVDPGDDVEGFAAALRAVGWDDVQMTRNWPDTITALASENSEALFVGLAAEAHDALNMIDRVRLVPEWAHLKIIGLIPSAESVDARTRMLQRLDADLRENGAPTPSLLIDIAENLLTLDPADAAHPPGPGRSAGESLAIGAHA